MVCLILSCVKDRILDLSSWVELITRQWSGSNLTENFGRLFGWLNLTEYFGWLNLAAEFGWLFRVLSVEWVGVGR